MCFLRVHLLRKKIRETVCVLSLADMSYIISVEGEQPCLNGGCYSNGENKTTTQQITAAWIDLINQMEQSKATLMSR